MSVKITPLDASLDPKRGVIYVADSETSGTIPPGTFIRFSIGKDDEALCEVILRRQSGMIYSAVIGRVIQEVWPFADPLDHPPALSEWVEGTEEDPVMWETRPPTPIDLVTNVFPLVP
jgi:hypothetical protein